jgi:hypothetical protein
VLKGNQILILHSSLTKIIFSKILFRQNFHGKKLAKFLNTKEENIDVLILNDAELVISQEVIKTNYPIYQRDKEERISF